MSLERAIDDFIEALIADGMKPKTVAWYRSLLGHLMHAFADARLKEIDTKMLRKHIVNLREQTEHWNGSQRKLMPGKLSEDTINAHVRSMHRFFRWCATEYSTPNPMLNIRYPKKPEAKPKAIATDNLLKLFDACDGSRLPERDRAILALLIDTGCRAGGLVGLRIDDVDMQAQKAIVTEKGNKTRTIYFTRTTQLILSEYVARRSPDVSPLFYNLDTLEPLTTYGLRHLLKRLAKRAGVTGRVNPHSFRHSFAREYLRAGGDLSTLSRLMGHRDVTTTVHHYAIFSQDEVREAHEKYSPGRLLGGINKNAPSEDEASD
jgi:site-specific recombinase XerD